MPSLGNSQVVVTSYIVHAHMAATSCVCVCATKTVSQLLMCSVCIQMYRTMALTIAIDCLTIAIDCKVVKVQEGGTSIQWFDTDTNLAHETQY